MDKVAEEDEKDTSMILEHLKDNLERWTEDTNSNVSSFTKIVRQIITQKSYRSMGLPFLLEMELLPPLTHCLCFCLGLRLPTASPRSTRGADMRHPIVELL